MLSFLNAFLICSLWLGSAQADSDVIEAEQQRLSDEIRNLSRRQVWKGVEDKYTEIVALGATPSFRDYLYAAHAARALGDISSVYDRLLEAAQIEPTKEVIDWLWSIDKAYGEVVLIGDRRGSALEMERLPIDPTQRAAVAAACEKVAEFGTFTGVLPAGDYVFNGSAFEVRPETAIHIDVAKRAKSDGSRARR